MSLQANADDIRLSIWVLRRYAESLNHEAGRALELKGGEVEATQRAIWHVIHDLRLAVPTSQ